MTTVKSPCDPHLSLPLSVLTITVTSLALLAATFNIRWGAAIPSGRSDALEFAWIYVNVSIAALTFLVWPALRLTHRTSPLRQLNYDAATLAACALPALSSAAVHIPIAIISCTLALQIALLLFARGLLALAHIHPRIRPFVAALTATLLAVAPVALYFWLEFFNPIPQAWSLAIPLIAIIRSAQPNPPIPLIWIAALYAAIGVALSLRPPKNLKPIP